MPNRKKIIKEKQNGKINRTAFTPKIPFVIIKTHHLENNKKAGEYMPNNAEIVKITIDDFREIQRYMSVAKEENAMKTYAELKEKYISLKALLNVLGVNLTDIDKIKE